MQELKRKKKKYLPFLMHLEVRQVNETTCLFFFFFLEKTLLQEMELQTKILGEKSFLSLSLSLFREKRKEHITADDYQKFVIHTIIKFVQ